MRGQPLLLLPDPDVQKEEDLSLSSAKPTVGTYQNQE